MQFPVERVRAVLKMASNRFRCRRPSGTATKQTSAISSKISPPKALPKYQLQPSQRQIKQCALSLNERERKVLELRFGLGDGYPRTLEEVGKTFRVTRERIRQIEAKPCAKCAIPHVFATSRLPRNSKGGPAIVRLGAVHSIPPAMLCCVGAERP